MHAGCQRTVTGQNRSTALIVRELSRLWQRKSLDRWKYYFRFNPLWNNDISADYLRSDPFSNVLPGYQKGTTHVQEFSHLYGSYPAIPRAFPDFAAQIANAISSED
jgi:hypothetical protein